MSGSDMGLFKQPGGESGPFDMQSWTTSADRGLIERPILAPHLEFRPIDERTVLLVSETTNTALYGQRYLDLLPLMDGTRSRHEIAASLSGTHSPIEVQAALASLAAKRHIVSGEFSLKPETAAFWSMLGVSPRFAEERLGEARVALVGDDRALARQLERMGVAVATEFPTLTVAITDDYLDQGFAETNRLHIDSGLAWMLVKPGGAQPLIGPVFQPGGDGACWACLEHRLRGNREVDAFLRNVFNRGAPILPNSAAPAFVDAIYGLAAVEIAKWHVLGSATWIDRHAISLDAWYLSSESHPVMRRPQCFVCGDEELYRADRRATPIRLQPSEKTVCNSGGLRRIPPGETVRKFRHLVSPVSGVVTNLARSSNEEDSWLHVYWAGSNLALKSPNLLSLRNSLRTKSSGKGSTRRQSEASALCEALERYSGVYQGNEIRRRARFADFSAPGEALLPNDIQLFSDWQYDNAAEINACGARFNHVPDRFDPTVEMDWTPVWSLTHERHRYLPTSMLYFSVPVDTGNGRIYCPPDSNGCAAGNTLEEAILQGFFELAERDAFACWWYNRLRLPRVDIDSFGDEYLSGAEEYYRSVNRDIWVIDVTNDLGIPVFVGVSRRTDKEAEDILYSAGAHSDPRIAALRAVCELNQYLSAIRNAKSDGTGYGYDDPECNWWWQNAKIADHPYLLPDADAPIRSAGDYRTPETADVLEEVEYCRATVERAGMEFLALDQTRPDIGLPVARVIVPGLRHFWARFAPGRLFDTPVRMGWIDKPVAEADLNPVSVFI